MTDSPSVSNVLAVYNGANADALRWDCNGISTRTMPLLAWVAVVLTTFPVMRESLQHCPR